MLKKEKGLSPTVKMQQLFSMAFITLERGEEGEYGEENDFVQMCRTSKSFYGFPGERLA